MEIQFHAQTKNRVDALLNNIDSEENASLLISARLQAAEEQCRLLQRSIFRRSLATYRPDHLPVPKTEKDNYLWVACEGDQCLIMVKSKYKVG